MSAALAHETLAVNSAGNLEQADAARGGTERLAETVVELVRLAGGRVQTWAFEPAALLLVRAGILDGAGLTFGSDYDLKVHSRELCRGFVEAVGRGRLGTTSVEMWLNGPDAEVRPTDNEREQLARAIFELPRAELEQTARRQLLGE